MGYLCDGNKDVRSRILEKVREWIISRFSPQLLLDVLQKGVPVASEGDDHTVRKQAVHRDVLGHQMVAP